MTSRMFQGDYELLNEIHDKSFELPQQNDIIAARIGFDNGGHIVAGALVKRIYEGLLILDQSQPKLLKTKLTIELIEELKEDMRLMNLKECHVFPKDPTFSDFLQNRLNFSEVKTLVWKE